MGRHRSPSSEQPAGLGSKDLAGFLLLGYKSIEKEDMKKEKTLALSAKSFNGKCWDLESGRIIPVASNRSMSICFALVPGKLTELSCLGLQVHRQGRWLR